MVLVDGALFGDLVARGDLPASVQVLPLAQALGPLGETLRERLGRVFALGTDGVAAMGVAALADALVVHVPRGVAVSGPLEIVHVASGGAAAPHFGRVFLAVDATSELTVIERFVGAPEAAGEARRPAVENRHGCGGWRWGRGGWPSRGLGGSGRGRGQQQ